EQAAIVSSPRIFTGLTAPPVHGELPSDSSAADKAAAAANATGEFAATVEGEVVILAKESVGPLLDRIVAGRHGSGAPTAADSAALRAAFPAMIADMMRDALAGGACAGYGLLLDISDPAHPTRIDAVADSNFSYWHSATFNNDGTKLLFSDEWGGGSQPKCRATDPREWGADAIFTLADRKLRFRSYYKLPAPQ